MVEEYGLEITQVARYSVVSYYVPVCWRLDFSLTTLCIHKYLTICTLQIVPVARECTVIVMNVRDCLCCV